MASLLSVIVLFAFFTSSQFLYSSAQSNRKVLRVKGFKNDNIIQLGSRAVHSNRIDPSRVVQLSWQPRVFLYEGFLSDEECDRLISLAQGLTETTLRGDDDDSGSSGTNSTTASSEAHLDEEDDMVAGIQERISAWTFIPNENGRPLQIMHHGIENAEQTLDYYGNMSSFTSTEPLLITVVIYLSNVARGGEIIFPSAKQKNIIWSDCTKTTNSLKPVKGNAILFFTRHLNASVDTSSSHARCPILDGEMWYAIRMFSTRPLDRETMEIESRGSECSDEDDNCADWAAIGECQKNPVFMVGTTDYYGTCRKSCNECSR